MVHRINYLAAGRQVGQEVRRRCNPTRRAVFFLILIILHIAPFHEARDARAYECLIEHEIESIFAAEAKPVTLSYSKRYDEQKQIVLKTVLRFIHDDPSRSLFYGDLVQDVTTERIGIALLDISGDGKQGIVFSVGISSWCSGRGSCPFGILFRKAEQDWKVVLYSQTEMGHVSLLRTSHHGFPDVRFDFVSRNGELWTAQVRMFDGHDYSSSVTRETRNSKKGASEIVSTTLFDPRALRHRFVDKR